MYKVKPKVLSASKLQTRDGFVVLQGSEAAIKLTPSIAMGRKRIRSKLIEEGVLKEDGKGYYSLKIQHFLHPPLHLP